MNSLALLTCGVFISSPQVRLQRLKDREFERYDEIIYNDPNRAQAYQIFIN
jgi:hypothetical protein